MGCGGDHGLCFNWRKVDAEPMRCVSNVLGPDGHPVECKSSLVYLGSLLHDARDILGQSSIADWTRQELICKLSIECGRMLALRMFDAYIGSFLRKLDGFQARCLRNIHAYLSRISNVEVLKP